MLNNIDNPYEKAEEALNKVSLKHRKLHFPHELSGGENQRVAIARAIINKPLLILADEPTGNLDSKNTREVENILFKLTKEENIKLIIVTHNELLAQKCNSIITLENGDFYYEKRL